MNTPRKLLVGLLIAVTASMGAVAVVGAVAVERAAPACPPEPPISPPAGSDCSGYFVTGGGHITEGKGKERSSVNFGGNAGYRDGSLVGHWTFNFKGWNSGDVKIRTTAITALEFYDFGGDPAPPEADVDTAAMVATAKVSVDNGPWQDGCKVHAVFVDGGEPQDDVLLSFDVDCESGAFVWEHLTGGNIQIHAGGRG